LAIGSLAGGGSERQLLEALKHLDRGRYVPELYVVYPGGVLLEEVPSDVPVHVFADRYAIPRRFLPGTIHRARIRDFAGVLEARRIDVVYDRTYHMTLTTAGAVRRRPTPRVSTIVSDPEREFESNRERFRTAKRWLLQRAYRHADVVAAVSHGVRQRAIDYFGLPPERVETFYNVFDVDRLDALAKAPLSPELARREGRFRVVAVGNLTPPKAYDVLMEAMRRVVFERGRRQVELVIAGGGPGEPALRRQIAGAQLQHHVTLAGFQRNPLPLMRSADLFCLSSVYEGMPNALAEAMLCGVPVLSTDCDFGPRELLENGRYGRLVPPGNAEALAAAIEDAVLDLPAWQSDVSAAREHVVRTFSVAAGIDRLMDLLDKAVERFPAP
jgi:glycosyltransferase involved in cell wall biosynthesis